LVGSGPPNFTTSRAIGNATGFVEVDDGEWDLYLGPVKFARFHEPLLNVEDAFGRLARHHAKV